MIFASVISPLYGYHTPKELSLIHSCTQPHWLFFMWQQKKK